MVLPDTAFYKIGMKLLERNERSAFLSLAMCSKGTLDVFMKEGNLFSLYKLNNRVEKESRDLWCSLVQYGHKHIAQQQLFDHLARYERYVRRQTIDDHFIDTHRGILSAIKFEIEYILKETHVRANNGVFIGFRDRLFGVLFRDIEVMNDRHRVTHIFNGFIKGITYFQDELVQGGRHPFYHRHGSCPFNGERNKKCTVNQHNHLSVEKCFLERLIYDRLWEHYIHSPQDKGHQDWLENTRLCYQTCFPETQVSVAITNYRDDMPITVVITMITGKRTKETTYTHSYDPINKSYLDFVSVSRKDRQLYTWVNTFRQEGTPMLLVGGKRRTNRKRNG